MKKIKMYPTLKKNNNTKLKFTLLFILKFCTIRAKLFCILQTLCLHMVPINILICDPICIPLVISYMSIVLYSKISSSDSKSNYIYYFFL